MVLPHNKTSRTLERTRFCRVKHWPTFSKLSMVDDRINIVSHNICLGLSRAEQVVLNFSVIKQKNLHPQLCQCQFIFTSLDSLLMILLDFYVPSCIPTSMQDRALIAKLRLLAVPDSLVIVAACTGHPNGTPVCFKGEACLKSRTRGWFSQNRWSWLGPLLPN